MGSLVKCCSWCKTNVTSSLKDHYLESQRKRDIFLVLLFFFSPPHFADHTDNFQGFFSLSQTLYVCVHLQISAHQFTTLFIPASNRAEQIFPREFCVSSLASSSPPSGHSTPKLTPRSPAREMDRMGVMTLVRQTVMLILDVIFLASSFDCMHGSSLASRCSCAKAQMDTSMSFSQILYVPGATEVLPPSLTSLTLSSTYFDHFKTLPLSCFSRR